MGLLPWRYPILYSLSKSAPKITQVAYHLSPAYIFTHTLRRTSSSCFKMPSVRRYVAIFQDDGVYKHWALFIDEPQADETLLHVKGSDGRFRYEPEKRDARQSKSLVELVYLCDVDVAKAKTIRDVARKVPVHNEISGWNCQDYVLDLLDALEGKGVMDNQDAGYTEQKSYVEGKQEGLA